MCKKTEDFVVVLNWCLLILGAPIPQDTRTQRDDCNVRWDWIAMDHVTDAMDNLDHCKSSFFGRHFGDVWWWICDPWEIQSAQAEISRSAASRRFEVGRIWKHSSGSCSFGCTSSYFGTMQSKEGHLLLDHGRLCSLETRKAYRKSSTNHSTARIWPRSAWAKRKSDSLRWHRSNIQSPKPNQMFTFLQLCSLGSWTLLFWDDGCTSGWQPERSLWLSHWFVLCNGETLSGAINCAVVHRIPSTSAASISFAQKQRRFCCSLCFGTAIHTTHCDVAPDEDWRNECLWHGSWMVFDGWSWWGWTHPKLPDGLCRVRLGMANLEIYVASGSVRALFKGSWFSCGRTQFYRLGWWSIQSS